MLEDEIFLYEISEVLLKGVPARAGEAHPSRCSAAGRDVAAG